MGEGEEALGFARSDVSVVGVDAAIEVVRLGFEAVFVRAGGGAGVRGSVVVAAAGAGESDFEGREKEEGEVGLEVVADGGVQSENACGTELATCALISFG